MKRSEFFNVDIINYSVLDFEKLERCCKTTCLLEVTNLHVFNKMKYLELMADLNEMMNE